MQRADIAYVLESLPLEERLVVWNLVKADRDGEILLEASDAVRETLIRSMDLQELVAAAEQLEADEIADLAPDLPEEVIHDVFQALPVEEREQLRAAMSYPEDAVGALMDFDVVSVREDTAIETVTRYLRRFDALPHHTDQIFVVDRDERLKGVLPLSKLIVRSEEHTSELQSHSDLVCRLLLEKKKELCNQALRLAPVRAATFTGSFGVPWMMERTIATSTQPESWSAGLAASVHVVLCCAHVRL